MEGTGINREADLLLPDVRHPAAGLHHMAARVRETDPPPESGLLMAAPHLPESDPPMAVDPQGISPRTEAVPIREVNPPMAAELQARAVPDQEEPLPPEGNQPMAAGLPQEEDPGLQAVP